MRRRWTARRFLAPALGVILLTGLVVGPAASGAEEIRSGSLMPDAVVPAAATSTTISGADRYATAVAISRVAYPAGADTVVVGNGRTAADALGGGVLAGTSGGPILLADREAVTEATLDELKRLSPRAVFILGGTASISESVYARIVSAVPDAEEIRRLEGANRYETAGVVASETIDAMPPSWGGQALVASGRVFADALAAGPFAIATRRPLYLIDAPSAGSVIAEMRRAGVTKLAVLGGDAAVSPEIRAALSREFGAANIDRVEGATRYETAARLADLAVKYSGFSLAEPGLASGDTLVDALAAGPLLAQSRAPLLLAPRRTLNAASADWWYAKRGAVATLRVFGGPNAVTPVARQDVLMAMRAPRFDSARAMQHVRDIAGFGPRQAGGATEAKALDYVAAQLASWGYTIGRQRIAIPGGRVSGNVFAERKGTSSEVIVIGAHIDSKSPSRGANDNASGVAVMLETARILAQADVTPTVRFIAFGAEEISGATPDDHHFGSRGYVDAIDAAQRTRIAAMISVDMVGYGDTFNVRNLGAAAPTAVQSLQGRGLITGVALPYLRDPSRYGWSDHEAFERAGIPSAWLEWREDPLYHTTGDIASHVNENRVLTSGALVRGWLLGMSPSQLAALR